jgi:hypothetical protein
MELSRYYLYPFLPYKSEGVGTGEGDYGYEWNMASLAVGSVWEGYYWVLSKSLLLLSVPSKPISIALILFVLLRTFFFPFAPPVCFHSVSLSVSFLSPYYHSLYPKLILYHSLHLSLPLERPTVA